MRTAAVIVLTFALGAGFGVWALGQRGTAVEAQAANQGRGFAAVPGTVGVITTLAAFDGVSARLAARVAQQPRLVVLTDLDAKGLEYDAAVVLDPDAIAAESPAGLRTLYVALTRATQRLYVVAPG